MYLVSSCLAGFKCRYDGNDNAIPEVIELINRGEAIPVCPEQLGGLTTPRIPCEIIRSDDGGCYVIDRLGNDRTEAFRVGAEHCVNIAKTLGIKKAIMKAKSPSCGYGEIYDGSFSGKLIKGNGLVIEALLKEGIEIYTEKNCLSIIKEENREG